MNPWTILIAVIGVPLAMSGPAFIAYRIGRGARKGRANLQYELMELREQNTALEAKNGGLAAQLNVCSRLLEQEREKSARLVSRAMEMSEEVKNCEETAASLAADRDHWREEYDALLASPHPRALSDAAYNAKRRQRRAAERATRQGAVAAVTDALRNGNALPGATEGVSA